MSPNNRTKQELLLEVADLRLRMTEAEAILHAIRNYEVDALVVRAPAGDQVYALQDADRAYRQMVEEMHEGAATVTIDGLVLYANQQLTQLLGCPLEKIVGAPLADCLAPADRPRLGALLAEPGGGRLTAQLQVGDQRRVPVSVSASRMLLDEQPVALLLVTDLTYQNQADRVARLLHLAERLSAAVLPRQAAEAVVSGAIEALGAAEGFVAAPSEADGQLVILYAVSYSAQRARRNAALTAQPDQPAAEALATRGLIVVESAEALRQRYPHWAPPKPDGKLGALLALPLLVPDRLSAVLQVGFRGPHSFEADDRDFALAVAQQCAQALERASLYSELEQRVQARTRELQAANDRLADSNRRLTEEMAERRLVEQQLERSREDERARVARELHDELGAALTGLKLDVRQVLREVRLPDEAQGRLSEVSATIDSAMEAVRRMATELRPSILDEFGLLAALQGYFDEFLRKSGLKGKFVCELSELPLPGVAAIACFRIFQEALTNVVRHAAATRVVVGLEQDGDAIRLRVSDNGCGMPADKSGLRPHLGLVGMHERANLLGARLEIESEPGQGTTVRLRLPLGAQGR